MTNKKRYLSMAALALACALAFTGCGDDPVEDLNIVGNGAEFLLDGGKTVNVVIAGAASRNTAAEEVEEKTVYIQEKGKPAYAAKARVRKDNKAMTTTFKGTDGTIYQVDGKLSTDSSAVEDAILTKKEENSGAWDIKIAGGEPKPDLSVEGSPVSSGAPSIIPEVLKGYWRHYFEGNEYDEETGTFRETYEEWFFNEYTAVNYMPSKMRYLDNGILSIKPTPGEDPTTTFDVVLALVDYLTVNDENGKVIGWDIIGISGVSIYRYVVDGNTLKVDYYQHDGVIGGITLAEYNANPDGAFSGYELDPGNTEIYTRPN